VVSISPVHQCLVVNIIIHHLVPTVQVTTTLAVVVIVPTVVIMIIKVLIITHNKVLLRDMIYVHYMKECCETV